MQIHEHGLFQFRLSVVNGDRVIVAVKSMDQGLDRGLIDMTNIGRCLSGLLACQNGLLADEAESIDDHLPLN